MLKEHKKVAFLLKRLVRPFIWRAYNCFPLQENFGTASWILRSQDDGQIFGGDFSMTRKKCSFQSHPEPHPRANHRNPKNSFALPPNSPRTADKAASNRHWGRFGESLWRIPKNYLIQGADALMYTWATSWRSYLGSDNLVKTRHARGRELGLRSVCWRSAFSNSLLL